MNRLINQFRIEGKERVFILIFLFFLIFLSVHYSVNARRYDMANSGLYLFYVVQDCAITVWLYCALILISPNLFSINHLNQNNNKLSSLIKMRIGYKQHSKNHILYNAVVSFITILVVQILILILIHFFYTNVVLFPSEPTLNPKMFSNNDMLNLCIYISFVCVGFTVFSTFVYSLQSFINNSYLFRSIGFMLGIILYMSPIVINSTLKSIFPSAVIDYFLSGLCLSTLINPGLGTMSDAMNHPYIVFLIGCAIYMSLSFFFLRIMYKKERYCD